MDEIQKKALINALLTALYVMAVGAFMYYGGVNKIGKTNSILIPTTLLLLFVTSASITGYLIFGKPVQMYIDGKKKEAVSLVLNTLGIFSCITLVFILILVLSSK